MKKLFTIIAALLLVTATAAGCITIRIGGKESSKEESQTESATETLPEASPTETASEEPTSEEAPEEIDFAGVWKGNSKEKTMILLRTDGTVLYTELKSTTYNTVFGIPGTWKKESNEEVTIELGNDTGYGFRGTYGNGKLDLVCTTGKYWNDESFVKTDATEDDVRFAISVALGAMLDDGWYEANVYDASEKPYASYTEVKDGYLYIRGSFGKRDSESFAFTLIYESAEYRPALSPSCKILSSGGMGPDVEVDEAYFNQCYCDHPIGLPLTFKVENGLVVEILIAS